MGTAPREHYCARVEPVGNAELLARVATGDSAAWSVVVQRYGQTVWNATAGFRFDHHTRHDVCQTVWLKLYDKAATVEHPERLVGWLARVARNECIAVVRRRQRVVSLDDDLGDRTDVDADDVETRLAAADDREAVRLAFALLDERCRELLLMTLQEPPLSYDDLAKRLGVPRGSLGPTRRRCLQKLAAQPVLAAHLDAKELDRG